MKKSVFLFIVFFWVSFLFPLTSFASSCVVKPEKSFDSNPQCYYSSPPEDVDYYDSCYQQYLVMKSDYQTRCFRYWDQKQLENLTQLKASQVPQVVEKIVAPEVSPSPSPVQKSIKQKVENFSPNPFVVTEYPSSSPSSSVQPKSEGGNQNDSGSSGLRYMVNTFLNFFKNLFKESNL